MMPTLALILLAVMFLVVFVLRTVIQKRRTGDSGIRPGALNAPFGSVEWVAGWLFVAALAASVAAPIAELAGLEPWFTTASLRVAGLILAGLGVVLTFLAQLSMGDEWRIGVDNEEETELVTTGAFRVVRNPIFSCMIVFGLGLTLMIPNLIALLGLIMLIAAIELQVRSIEEPYLRKLHGEHYAKYASQVGRLLPTVGRD